MKKPRNPNSPRSRRLRAFGGMILSNADDAPDAQPNLELDNAGEGDGAARTENEAPPETLGDQSEGERLDLGAPGPLAGPHFGKPSNAGQGGPAPTAPDSAPRRRRNKRTSRRRK